MTNVLFVPNPMPSHIIPLIALDKLLNKNYFKTSFLLPKNFHLFIRKIGASVLDIDKEFQFRTTSEMIAFAKFKPDVLVDDLHFTSAFSTRFAKIPRISIVRKGILPHEEYKPGVSA
jgi:UDP:flavonoid glycosyltransferase YjiC (YdhE family)